MRRKTICLSAHSVKRNENFAIGEAMASGCLFIYEGKEGRAKGERATRRQRVEPRRKNRIMRMLSAIVSARVPHRGTESAAFHATAKVLRAR